MHLLLIALLTQPFTQTLDRQTELKIIEIVSSMESSMKAAEVILDSRGANNPAFTSEARPLVDEIKQLCSTIRDQVYQKRDQAEIKPNLKRLIQANEELNAVLEKYTG